MSAASASSFATAHYLADSNFSVVFLCVAEASFAQAPAPLPARSIVYSVRDTAAIDHFRTNEAVVRRMVDRLVTSITAEADVGRAWATFVAPTDIVGIKISATGGELFTTHRDVVNAISHGVAAAGVPRRNIILWDRELGGVERAGYRAGREGYQLRSIEPREGFDSKAQITAPLMGKLIWGDLAYIPRRGENPIAADAENTSNVSHIAKILSSEVTKIINVPVMSQNEATGVAGCLSNMTLPNIDNARRFTQFGSIGAASIAEIFADERIGRKVVLNIMDGLVALYAGGPESHPNYAVHHATLLASRDPVALDALALERIDQWRAKAQLPPIGERGAHVDIAAQMGLGNSDRARIELREIRN